MSGTDHLIYFESNLTHSALVFVFFAGKLKAGLEWKLVPLSHFNNYDKNVDF